MLDAFLSPPLFLPSAISAAVCFGAGAFFSRVWIGLLFAEIFSILGLAFIYVIGGSLLNDELSVPSFMAHFYFSLTHAFALTLLSCLVFGGQLTRKLLRRRHA